MESITSMSSSSFRSRSTLSMIARLAWALRRSWMALEPSTPSRSASSATSASVSEMLVEGMRGAFRGVGGLEVEQLKGDAGRVEVGRDVLGLDAALQVADAP